jgi:hypothetical protein
MLRNFWESAIHSYLISLTAAFKSLPVITEPYCRKLILLCFPLRQVLFLSHFDDAGCRVLKSWFRKPPFSN